MAEKHVKIGADMRKVQKPRQLVADKYFGAFKVTARRLDEFVVDAVSMVSKK